MRKPQLFAIILLTVFTDIYSQDKIITHTNDTINCRINRVSRSTVWFDMISGGAISSARLPMANVASYTFAVKDHQGSRDAGFVERDFSRFRLGLNAGPGYMLASPKKAIDQMTGQGFTREKARSYYNDLKLGVSFSGDATWMITPGAGAGLRYKFLSTSAVTEGFIDPQDGINIYFTNYSEKIYANYGGIAFSFRQPVAGNESLVLNSSLSIGLTAYRNETEFLGENLLLTGKSLGSDASLGLEYFILPHLSAAAELSAFYSTLKKFKVTDGVESVTVELEKENYENISRLDFSLGLKIYLW